VRTNPRAQPPVARRRAPCDYWWGAADRRDQEIRSLCNVEGRFALTRRARVVFLTASERQALADELRAQIRACRENGIPLTHADSHHHVHEEWGIAAVVIAVCREQGIP
jgi:predicted glycoside hydrolase/deacetylase ChbG (UPF0249 family)